MDGCRRKRNSHLGVRGVLGVQCQCRRSRGVLQPSPVRRTVSGVRRTRCRGVARDVGGLGREQTGHDRIGASYCGGYPWDVTTGQGPQASQVNLGSVTLTTVGYLTSRPVQPDLPYDYHRVPPTEPSCAAPTPVSPPREAICVRAGIGKALRKEAARRVLGERYLVEVLIQKSLDELPRVELGG
jgi:hypothetical protein